jgi:hypothetical protein
MSVQIANAAGPLPALGADQAQDRVATAGCGDGPAGQVLQAAREGQVDGAGRGGQAGQVGPQPERPAAVDPHGLEHRLAPDQGKVERVETGRGP